MALFCFGSVSLLHVKNHAEKLQKESTAQEMRRTAAILANLVDWELHEKVKAEKDPQSENFRKATAPLVKAHLALPEVAYIYTFQADVNNVYVVLDTMHSPLMAEREGNASGIMETYRSEDPREDELLHSALLLHKPYQTKNPVEDKDGTLFTVVMPISDPSGEKTYSGLGIDITEAKLQERLIQIQSATHEGLFWIGFISLACGLFTAFIILKTDEATLETAKEKKSRLKAEQEKDLLAAIAQKTTHGIVICNPERKILWVNKSFEAITGYKEEELKGKSPGEILQGPDTRPENVRNFKTSFRRKENLQQELVNYRKDGSPYWAQVDIQPLLNEEKEVTHWIGLHTDISERKQRQEELNDAKEEAEANSKAKSEFIAVMSHEIRTPLNGVIGGCQLLLKTDPSEEQKEYLGYIEFCGQNLMETVEDILDFSKIEAGKTEAEEEIFRPEETLLSLTSLHQSTTKAKNVAFLTEINPNTKETFLGERKKIARILGNLIANAAKFTDKGHVQIKAEIRESCLFCEITDTGPGLPSEKQDKIFEAFIRGDASHTRKHRGTGLGLPIAKKLTEWIRGELKLVYSNAQGTQFLCKFPLKKPHSVPNRETPLSSPLPDLKILIVEDNPINQKILRVLLKKNGQTTCTCTNDGLEAINLLQEKKFDLIFMDLQMPNLDGIQATEEIRKMGIKTPIVALTATAEIKEKEKCFQVGMQEFMTKPFKESELQKTIRKYAGESKDKAP